MKRCEFPVLSGYHYIRGFFFPTDSFDSEKTGRKILSSYIKGAYLYKFNIGLILLFPEDIHIDTGKAPAVPIIKTEQFYSQIPFEYVPDRNSIPENSVVLIHKGEIRKFFLNAENIIDPSFLIDISEYRVLEKCEKLGAMPEPPELMITPVDKDSRQILGESIPAPSKKKLQIDKELKKIRGRKRSIFEQLTSLLKKGKIGKTKSRYHDSYKDELRTQPTHGLTSKISSFLMRTPFIWSILAGKHEKYLREMVKMFEKGDLNQALKHGISLGSAKNMTNSLPLWRRMIPRQDLSFTGAPKETGGGGVDYGTFEYLKKLYNEAFKKLKRKMQVKEAAFVLAELLSDYERAVSYLEENKLLKEAAELAESKELSPGIIIRQWFLCKETERAITIAKRTNAFSEAVIHLERTHPEKAEELRVIWAEYLEKSGDYNKAVDVIWPVENKRVLAKDWIEKGIDLGGEEGAIMLARRLSLIEEKREDSKERILKLLKSMRVEDFQAKSAFAKEFLSLEKNEYSKIIGRFTFKTVLRERINGLNTLSRKDLMALAERSFDRVLLADYKKTNPDFKKSSPSNLHSRKDPLVLTFRKKGVVRIYDAAPLNGGRFLIALGEAGVKIINSKRKTICHFNVPCSSLVISDKRNRCIALAKRGSFYRISKIDINRREAGFWYETALSSYAKTFDGKRWFIATGYNRVSAIDFTSESFKAIWSVKDIKKISHLSRDTKSLAFLTEDRFRQVFVYEVKGDIILRKRKDINLEPGRISLSPDGSLISLYNTKDTIDFVCDFHLIKKGGSTARVIKEMKYFEGIKTSPSFKEGYAAIPFKTEYGCDITVFYNKSGADIREILVLKIEICDKPVIRIEKDRLIIGDERGRVIYIDLKSGEILESFEV